MYTLSVHVHIICACTHYLYMYTLSVHVHIICTCTHYLYMYGTVHRKHYVTRKLVTVIGVTVSERGNC